MSTVDYLLISYAFGATIGGVVLYFCARTWAERASNVAEQALQKALNPPESKDYAQMSKEYVDLHRQVVEIQTVQENQGLRLTDTQDILERRFNRLRVRQSREAKEEGIADEIVSPEEQMQLLQDVNGPVQELAQPATPQRGRLRKISARTPYGRG